MKTYTGMTRDEQIVEVQAWLSAYRAGKIGCDRCHVAELMHVLARLMAEKGCRCGGGDAGKELGETDLVKKVLGDKSVSVKMREALAMSLGIGKKYGI